MKNYQRPSGPLFRKFLPVAVWGLFKSIWPELFLWKQNETWEVFFSGEVKGTFMLVYEFFPARRQHHLLVVWLSDSECTQHSDFYFPQYDRIASAAFCQKFGGTQVEKDSAGNMLWASQKLRTGTICSVESNALQSCRTIGSLTVTLGQWPCHFSLLRVYWNGSCSPLTCSLHWTSCNTFSQEKFRLYTLLTSNGY